MERLPFFEVFFDKARLGESNMSLLGLGVVGDGPLACFNNVSLDNFAVVQLGSFFKRESQPLRGCSSISSMSPGLFSKPSGFWNQKGFSFSFSK